MRRDTKDSSSMGLNESPGELAIGAVITTDVRR